MFAEKAIYMVMATDPDPTEEPDNSHRIIEYGIFQEWGEGERSDPWGVEIFSDVATTI